MSALRSLHFRTWYCLCGWWMGHWSAVTGPSGWRVTCQVDGDAAAEGSVRWVWEGTSGTQRCFKLGTVWRATCSFILRYWAHWEVCIRMGVGGSYPDLPFFFLLCSCFPLCSSLSHSGCHWFLSSSVGWILYFELCFRNTWLSCGCGKRMVIRSSVVLKSVVAEYQSLWQRGVCWFGLDPERDFAVPGECFIAEFSSLFSFVFLLNYLSFMVVSWCKVKF